MTIRIHKVSSGLRLVIPVPLVLGTSGLLRKALGKDTPYAKDMAKALREYRKENGSWNLVEATIASEDIRIVVTI